MSQFNTQFDLPGTYGQVITEASTRRNLAANVLGVVGPANSGPMEEVITISDPSFVTQTLGQCEAADLLLSAWANGAGEIKFVRVGATHAFDEVYMDKAATAASDLTTDVSRVYGQTSYFDTGAQDYLYVGLDKVFDKIYFSISTAAAFSGATALSAQYWNGSAWSALSITDATLASTKTMQNSGAVTFTAPNDWEVTVPTLTNASPLPSSLYWVRMRPANQPTTAPQASLIVNSFNATPAYGLLVDAQTHTGTVTTQDGGSPGTKLTDSGADFDNVSKPVLAGDSVRNSADGSSATVVTRDSATAITTTSLTGGIYNKFMDGASQAGVNVDALVTGTLDAVTANGSNTLITDTANYITQKVFVGDVLTRTISSNTTGGSSGTILIDSGATFVTNQVQVGDTVTIAGGGTATVSVVDSETQLTTTALSAGNYGSAVAYTVSHTRNVVSVISETQIIVSGVPAGLVTGQTYKIESLNVLYDASINFATDGVRPGQVITFGAAGSTTVLSLLDFDGTTCHMLLTSGLAGGTGTRYRTAIQATGQVQYTYTVAPDSYIVESPVEKAYFESKQWGTDGNNLAIEVVTSGSKKIVKISQSGTDLESFETTTADPTPLLTIISAINATSQFVTVEDLTAGTYDLPASMTKRTFTGGNNGSAVTADYITGLEKLLTEETVGVVMCVSNSDAVNAAVKSHISTAAGPQFQLSRIGVVAKPEDENFVKLLGIDTEAASLAFEGRMVYTVQRATIPSVVLPSGVRTSRAAMAGAIAGLIAGSPAAQPLTNSRLNVVDIDKVFNRQEKIELIRAGVFVIDRNANGINVVRSVTTTLTTPYNELSIRRAVDETEVDVRNVLNIYVGRVNEPGILTQIKATVEGVLDRRVNIPGIGGTLRAWRNVRVAFNTIDPTRVDVNYEVLPLSPINFIFTSMFVHVGIEFEI